MKKQKKQSAVHRHLLAQKAQSLAEDIQRELRGILRQWDKLHQPLRCIPKSPLPEGCPPFRIEGAESFEELEDQVLRYAGSVWQLKDRLKLWAEAQGLEILGPSPNGIQAKTTIEDLVNKSPNLLLCADLYNLKKHGHLNRPRTSYSPILNGVSFDLSQAGTVGIKYNGASKTGELTATHSDPIPYRIEIISDDNKFCFGDAVVVITQAFGFLIPVIRQIGVLKDNRKQQWILANFMRVEEYIKQTNQFKPNDNVTHIGKI